RRQSLQPFPVQETAGLARQRKAADDDVEGTDVRIEFRRRPKPRIGRGAGEEAYLALESRQQLPEAPPDRAGAKDHDPAAVQEAKMRPQLQACPTTLRLGEDE